MLAPAGQSRTLDQSIEAEMSSPQTLPVNAASALSARSSPSRARNSFNDCAETGAIEAKTAAVAIAEIRLITAIITP